MDGGKAVKGIQKRKALIKVETNIDIMGELQSPVIVPFDFERDYVDFILIEMDRFPQPMTRTLLSFLKKRYGDDFWYSIDIAGDERLDAYLVAGPEMNNERDVVHIYSIAVRRDFEGQGWAKKMMSRLISDARSADKSAIILEVRENNTRAIQFYDNLGFNTTGKQENYYNDGIDAIIMELNL